MLVMGIDPGAKGGAAIIQNGAFKIGIRMPLIQVGKKVTVDPLGLDKLRLHEPGQIVIEQVNAMPAQGVASSFQFGRMLGGVEAWAFGAGVPVEHVTPAKWKKDLGFPKGADKQYSLDFARRTFGAHPLWTVKANEGIAEAALLAYWFQQFKL